MNFSPNEQNYNNLYNNLESVLDNIADIKNIDFIISDDIDVIRDVEKIEKQLNKIADNTEYVASSASSDIQTLVYHDFDNALQLYADTARMFSDIDKSDYFYDNVDTFPFGEWFSLKWINNSFSHLHDFFNNLPQKDKDAPLFYHHLEQSISQNKSKHPQLDGEFFKDAISYVAKFDTTQRNKFLNEMFKKDNVYKNIFFIQALNNHLDKNYYDCEAIVSQYKHDIKEQLQTDKDKFVDFILYDKSNNNNYCTREYNKTPNYEYSATQTKIIHWKKLERLIDLDFELNLDISQIIIDKVSEIVTKSIKKEEENLNIFISSIQKERLEKCLVDKSPSKKIKI